MKAIGFIIVLGWIGRLAFLALGGLVIVGLLSQFGGADKPPDTDKAVYAIQSYTDVEGIVRPSRIYFTNDIVYEDGFPVIKDYWKLDGDDYKKVNEERVFTEPIKIVRRTP